MRLKRFLGRFLTERQANITILAALAMPVLVGSLGIGAEAASWYASKRSLQDAADSAAIAAATNGSSTYATDADAVAAQYGLQNGKDGVTVTAQDNVTCPGGSANCYSVTITKDQPLLLAQIVGFQGDTTVDGQPAKRLMAKAVAIQDNAPRSYCILALATSGAQQGIRTNGAPKADLSGCSIMSDTNSVCNGHDLNADYGDAHGQNDGCGVKRTSEVAAVSDPYEGLKTYIPDDKCKSYPKEPSKKNDPPLPSNNVLGGIRDDEQIDICGDAVLNSNLLLQGSGMDDQVIIIRNGHLNLNGYTISTRDGSHVTFVFTGTDTSRDHIPIGGGHFDISAPVFGSWKGMAIYQDPRTTGGVDLSDAGNSPTWDITGMVYMPHASVTFSGAVNKSSYGKSCFGMVVDNLTINGTGSILAHGECPAAGLTLPYSQSPGRGRLVS